MRTLVMVVGAIIALIGLSQIVAAPWWLRVLPAIMTPRDALVFGLIALACGVILVVAVLKRSVAWRPFVLVLGLLMLVGGFALVVNPTMMKNAMDTFVLSRSHGAQISMTVLGGIVRAVLGLLLIYAAAIKREPRVSTTNRPVAA